MPDFVLRALIAGLGVAAVAGPAATATVAVTVRMMVFRIRIAGPPNEPDAVRIG